MGDAVATDSLGPRHADTVMIHGVADPLQARDATNKQWVQSEIAGAIVAGGAPFEASNGWISGGIISFLLGSTQFDVSAMVCRFTDYTNETAPAMAMPVTLGPWANVDTLYPGNVAVGINIKSDGTIYQDLDPIDTSPLYGAYIHVGTIMHQGGLLSACSNSKYPVADRYPIDTTDFVQHVSPLNLNGNAVAASLTVTDLSISVAAGNVWQHMSQVATDRTNPSSRFKPAVDRPSLGRLWRNSGGTIVFDAPSQQLDVLNYNPSGTGAALVAIPAGYWVNIPIIYSPATNSYSMQYPTGAYATEQFAEENIGRFVRFDSIMKAVVVIGYVTVQEGESNLLDAEFSRGEFFNYTVYGSGEHTDVEFTTDFRSSTVFIDYGYGDDSEGQPNLPSAPYKTYNPAVAGITPTGLTNQWTVRAASGVHIEPSMMLKPNLALVGEAPRVAQFDVSASAVTLDASFSTPAASGSVSSLFCNRFINATPVVLDLFSLGSGPGKATSSIFDVRECGFYGDVAYHARTLSDSTFWVDTGIHQNWRFYGGTHYVFTAIMFGTGSQELLCDSTDVALEMTVSNMHAKNVTLLGPAGTHACHVTISASNIDGVITVNGSNAHLDISRGSLAAGVVVSLLNAGSYTIYDADITAAEEAAIHNATPAATGTNPFITLQNQTTALSGKADNAVTVNAIHSLGASFTISCSELSTGTLPHAQLPALLQADIPMSLLSNTSGYAGSLNGTQTIPGGSFMQVSPALHDNTTAIATTAWVYTLRGESEGLAQLTGGKVPLAQIPDSLTTGLKYMGTWDIAGVDGTIYPAGTLSGEFWIVTSAGTMGYAAPTRPTTAFDVGDWFVYNAATLPLPTWQKVPITSPVLSTWTGNSYIQSVGTITTGTWNASVIDVSHGGAGTLSGILRGNGVSAVGVASSTTDYVAPSGASTIDGAKTFSGGLYSTTSLDWTTSGSAVANASFVQNLATFPQDQVIFVSNVGDDAYTYADNAGKSIRSAVKTVNRAVALATYYATTNGTALSSVYQYGIVCHDAGMNDTVSMGEFTSFEGTAMRLTGTTYVPSYCKVSCRRMDSPGGSPAVILHYNFKTTGGGIANVQVYRILGTGKIVVDPNMGQCVLLCEIANGVASPNRIIELDGGALPNISVLHVHGSILTGRILVTAPGIVDISNVADVTGVDIDPSSTGTVVWPASGAGNVSGLLKCNGAGTVTAAVVGVDYLTSNQTITLGSDLSGSGSSTLNATIANSAVTLAKMANLAAMHVLGNSTGTLAPNALLLSADIDASSVVWRDASVNSRFNHATESYTNSSAALITLSIASAKTLEVTGVAFAKVKLPDATTLPLGYAFNVLNSNSTNIDVCKADGIAVVLTLEPGVHSQFVVTDVASSNGLWSYARANQLITLTGDVTASGRSPIATTLAPVALSKLASIAANSLVGNPTGSPAAPSTIANSVTMTGDVSWTGAIGSSTAATIGAGSLSYAKLATIGTGLLLGNFTGSTASPGTVGAAVTMNGDVAWVGTLNATSGASITAGAITLDKFANLPAYTFIANPTNVPAATYLSINITMGGDVLWSGAPGSDTDATIGPNAVSFGKMQQIGPGRLIGNTTAGTTNPGTVTATVAMTGDVAWTSTIGSTAVSTIGANVVSFAKMQQIGTGTLLGNFGGSLANIGTVGAAIAMNTSLGEITWTGTIGATSGATIGANVVSFAKMQTIGALQLLGNSTTTAGVNVATVPMASVATAGAVCIRDVNANGAFNSVVVSNTSIATAGTTTGLAVSSPGSIVFTGTNVQTVTLPDATTLPVGWQVRLFNRSTGDVTVNSGTSLPVSTLSGGMSGVFVSTANTPVGGVWSAALSSRWPLPPCFNSMTTAASSTGGGTLQLTALQIYNGPQAIAKSGGGTLFFRFPNASDMIAYISSQAGTGSTGGALTPPVGFSWTTLLYCSAQSNTMTASPGTGVTFFPATPPNMATVGHTWDCKCWITSATTYNVLFIHDP